MSTSPRARVALSLALLYVIWGSTYLSMRIALGAFPPLLMAGARHLTAGAAMYAWLRFRGAAPPTRRQWLGSGAVGLLLLGFGNAGVAVAEQWVASGLAAVVVASVPLWAAGFSALLGRWPARREAAGLAIGAAGVSLLNVGQLSGESRGALVLLGASAAWALGSVLSRRLDQAAGLMASAAQMVVGGAALLGVALAHGDRPAFAAGPVAAELYLIVFGSMVAYSAYGYLLRTVSSSLATSYAFVNPVVAVLLGVALGHEAIGWGAVGAMAVILAGVALVVLPRPLSKVPLQQVVPCVTNSSKSL
jgi:drug/metabolite transporter (DMT)-like permease